MSSDDIDRFFVDYPLIDSVELLLPDLVGIPRGKRISLAETRRCIDGLGLFSTTLYALDTTGANVDRSGLVWEEGDADRPIALDRSTLRAVPWREKRAQIIGGLLDHDNTPFFADPRAVLRQVQATLKSKGYRPVAAVELEFYLLDESLDHEGLPQVPISARLGRRPSDPEVYMHERFEEAEAFFELLEHYCEAQALPVKGALSEFAPGQFELNLGHVEDVVQACDDSLMFKRCVHAAARQTGRRATFMAKPFEQQSGSGMHIHVSMLDDDGRNVLSEVEDGDDRLRHAVWGLQQTMGESVLLMAPNANSYRRLQPMSYAPTATTWGYNNRTVALRIPAGPGSARRIEHRVAGADANPYLVMAAVIAGICHGLDGKGDPGEPIKGNAYDRRRIGRIPTSWCDALTAFDQAKILPAHLGERFCKLYAACRRAEYDRFEARITPTEIAWYMATV